MDSWDWEFFEAEVTSTSYFITDHGPLFGPVTDFKIVRDESLDLVLETTSAADSTSAAVERPAGSVYTTTDDVKLEGRFGAIVAARGIIPRRHTKSRSASSTPNTTKEISTAYSLHWIRQNAPDPSYIMEWVENLSSSWIWPHLDDVVETGEGRRTLKGSTTKIVLSKPIDSKSLHRSCAHLVIEGVELFIGKSRAKPAHIANPGFILYVGTPDETTRSKIRDCLSFCLGDFLIYLGYTMFDSAWHPVAFDAKSGHALVEEAPNLNGWQPAPLSTRWDNEIDPNVLGRMASSLYRAYDPFQLQTVFWNYWHAVAAPVHMTAAHFGAAIEGLQRSYFKTRGVAATKIVEEDRIWKDLSERISSCITEAALSSDAETMLVNKARNLNVAPQSVIMKRFFAALGLEIGTLESEAWSNRNRAAHGGGADAENACSLIRENKVLKVMMNRLLLALEGGSDHYYDYYNLGRPTVPLANAVQTDAVRSE